MTADRHRQLAYPADVEKAARAVVERLCPFRFAEERRTFVVEKWPVVARAIMADRLGQTAGPLRPAPPPVPASRRVAPTSQQLALLNFIKAYSREWSIMPSYAEMAEALGLRSKGNINRLLTGLKERGHIYWLPNRTRAIVVLD